MAQFPRPRPAAGSRCDLRRGIIALGRPHCGLSQSVAPRCSVLHQFISQLQTVQHMSCGDFIGSMNGHPYLNGLPSSS